MHQITSYFDFIQSSCEHSFHHTPYSLLLSLRVGGQVISVSPQPTGCTTILLPGKRRLLCVHTSQVYLTGGHTSVIPQNSVTFDILSKSHKQLHLKTFINYSVWENTNGNCNINMHCKTRLNKFNLCIKSQAILILFKVHASTPFTTLQALIPLNHHCVNRSGLSSNQ